MAGRPRVPNVQAMSHVQEPVPEAVREAERAHKPGRSS